MAALPGRQRAGLDVSSRLATAELADTSRSLCEFLTPVPPEVRKRLRLRWSDGDVVILFVRGDTMRGTIGRVEFVRRNREGEQRGYIWDGETGSTKSVDWILNSTATTEVEIPAGVPLSRALRGLGRRLLLLDCSSPRSG